MKDLVRSSDPRRRRTTATLPLLAAAPVAAGAALVFTGPAHADTTLGASAADGFTNHPGIVDFKGGSSFYHNGALPGGGGFTRSVAVERFSYNANGAIPTINMTTTGAPQIGTLNPYGRQEAETIAWESGVETQPSSEGAMNVGWIENADWIKVKGAASATGGGWVEQRLGGGCLFNVNWWQFNMRGVPT